jgi:hypothetical protein
MKNSLEISIKANLRTLLDKESEIKSFLRMKIINIVDVHLEEFKIKICLPLLDTCYENIVLSYEQCLIGFHKEILNHFNINKKDYTIFKEDLKKFKNYIEYINSSILLKSKKILIKTYTIDLIPVQDIFKSSGMTFYNIYYIIDKLRVLMRNSIHTFDKLYFPDGDLISTTTTTSSFNEVLNTVISRLTSDLKNSIHETLLEIVTNAMESKIQELLILPSYEPIYEYAKHILYNNNNNNNQLINLKTFGITMIREAIKSFLTSLIGDLHAEASSRLNLVAVQLLNSVENND